MEESEKKTGEILISEFPNVRSKSPRIITLEQFVANLTGDKYSRHVQAYRRLSIVPGKEGEAKTLKERTPCIVPAGVCQGGHKVTDLTCHSNLVCIDLDHTDRRTESIMQTLTTLPWVVLAFISISGNGVKVMVRVTPEAMRQGYEPLYHAVGRAVSQAVGHPYDEKCKILTQPCYYSWHPAAHYNPKAATFGLPATSLPTPPTQAATTAPATATASATVTTSVPPPAAASQAGFLPAFIESFEHRHPFLRGRRNDICMTLGREAASKGFSKEELDTLLQIYIRHHAVSDFTASDIRQRVISGYQFISEKRQEKSGEARDHFGVRVTYDPSTESDPEPCEEDLLEKNNELRASTASIPAEVYEALPPLLLRCVQAARDERERDLLLLGSLNACSALLPLVRFSYQHQLYSPHFYLAVVAPAGTGKGMLTFTSVLADPTQDHYNGLLQMRKRQYEEALLAWDYEQQKARQEKRKPDIALKPEPFRPQYFKASATTSKSRLIETLAAAGETGCYMFSSEIATLNSAIGQDFGKYEDILLKAAHHEEISSSFKVDGEPLVVRNPHLAICLSGTQETFGGFFNSLESGLYSRFAFYTREQKAVWQSCEPDSSGPDWPAHYRQLGEELKQMHLQLLQSPTRVSFSHKQWERHTSLFSAELQRVSVEGMESAQGIIFRHGLLAARLAALLTAFRKYDAANCAEVCLCSDRDFRTALLIVQTVLGHSLLLSTSLPHSVRQPVALHKFHRIEETLKLLPRKFAYTEFIEAACSTGASQSTAKRLLRKVISSKVVVKEEDRYIKTEPTVSGEGHR